MNQERGYVMVALLAAIAILLIGMGAAAPTWKYVMQDSREQELIFRGSQIADAIGRYQRKHANALPTSIEQLVKGKFLRREYADPMTADGKWRLLRPGEVAGVPGRPGAPGGTPGAGPRTPGAQPASPGGFGAGTGLGPIAGVASRSTESSLRIFNGRTRYSEWLFMPGQPRVIGRPRTPEPRQPGTQPRPSPSPSVR
ncbi:MAG: hypothetical protein KJ067_24405 [Vicinamibacteria bacterium]|nr:hypothetical protein [Vicinamibacteria bacterium]